MRLWPRRRRGWRRRSSPARRACSTSVSSPGTGRTLLRLASKVYVVERRKENWLDRAHALLTEATRLAELAARPDPVARVEAPALRLNGAALELMLRALSTRPATPEELDQIRKLLDERKQRDQNA